MQSATNSLRACELNILVIVGKLKLISLSVSHRQTQRSLIPHQAGTSSRLPIIARWEQRRGYDPIRDNVLSRRLTFSLNSRAWSPVKWFQRSLTPKIREKDSEREIEEARQRARASGEASVFDYEVPATVEAGGKTVTVPSVLDATPSEVRFSSVAGYG
jgi:hypothetical protein